ncbi:MAG: hypothetical protein ABW185_20525 [Sedimenticola sp.]
MATITSRKWKTSIKYTAQIRVQLHGRRYTESKTFAKKSLAKKWAQAREGQLSNPGNLERVMHEGITIKELISTYREEVSSLRKFGRSKDAHLKFLMEQPLAEKNALALKSADLVEHVRARRLSGTGGSTVNNDIVWLRIVFKYARSAWNMPLDLQQVEDAAETVRQARLVSRPRRRKRRPTADELRSLMKYFNKRTRSSIPMGLIIWFAIYSCRRQDEIRQIRRNNLDEVNNSYLAQDLKHPDGSDGNDHTALLPEQGWVVVDAILEQVGMSMGVYCLSMPKQSVPISQMPARCLGLKI